VEILYGKGLIQIAPGTDLLAGMMANPTAYTRERMLLFKELQGFTVFALVYQCYKALDAHMGRTGSLTRSRASLFNCKGTGHGLGVELISSFSIAQPLIKE
jgi:hypothetical protein